MPRTEKSARTPLVDDHRAAALAGMLLTAVGAFLIWDAYEGRGGDRPFLLRIFSGIT